MTHPTATARRTRPSRRPARTLRAGLAATRATTTAATTTPVMTIPLAATLLVATLLAAAPGAAGTGDLVFADAFEAGTAATWSAAEGLEGPWAGSFEGYYDAGGPALFGRLTFEGPVESPVAVQAGAANGGVPSTYSFSFDVAAPCPVGVDEAGTTVTLTDCPLASGSILFGNPVGPGFTMDLVGVASVVEAGTGRVLQMQVTAWDLYYLGAYYIDVGASFAGLPLDRTP